MHRRGRESNNLGSGPRGAPVLQPCAQRSQGIHGFLAHRLGLPNVTARRGKFGGEAASRRRVDASVMNDISRTYGESGKVHRILTETLDLIFLIG